ncbi:SusC/RagA family TonB-linked outer membrane protein [Pedobacter cryoconitis]|uniref:TonB-linked SusC/RagA family outer membrane protein n=1 Tax=Pedobacter cryoconitis TaxID=188932 RepID=A0A7X0J5E1_9SPHI|nr:TonB-dependent receptor [Pedobacter cryoconitis]MBB6501180.1 TonB-linked SusC/RagA family outer membrane protein [Pedobacter cryoconitis]
MKISAFNRGASVFRTYPKLLLILKLTTFILMIAFVQASATVLAQKINLNQKNKPLSTVLQDIKNQTGYVFLSNDFDPAREIVSVSLTNATIDEALNACLNKLSINYNIVDKTILLNKIAHSPRKSEQITVRGIVKDEHGLPIPGAGVKIKGSLSSTSTDVNGSFSISVPSASAILQFTYVGYQPLEVTVGSQRNLSISLKPSDNALEEVAVVGFGTQRKVSLIGAQSTIDAKELKQPVSSITQSLAGRISGVVGVQRSGEPGRSTADIWIRGIATFGGNSSAPLILVDGVERSIDNIDPEDIESFTVLKDASGTAVYGVRGANGVVIVKTKTGQVGKSSILFDYNEGISTFTRRPQMADGVTYMNMANEASTGRGLPVQYTQDYINKTASGADPLLYPNVNWMNELFNKYSSTRRANLSTSGGVEKAQYYVSLAFYNETGYLKTNDLAQYNSSLDYKRYNFTSNLNLKLTGTTKLDLGIQGYASVGNYPALNTEDIFRSALDASPVAYPVMYPGGFVPGQSSNGGFRNPYADLTTRGYRSEFKSQLYTNIRLTQDLKFITTGLTATAMFSFDAYNQNFINRSKRESTYFPVNVPGTDSPYKADGSLNLQQTYTSTQNYLSFSPSQDGNHQLYNEVSLNYDKAFGKHRVGGLFTGYSSDLSKPFVTDFTSSIPYRAIGLATRATYSYDDRYFAELNFGYNGSELFSPGNRYGSFPAFGIGWIPSSEKFWEPLKNVVSFLKFRYSDGKTGIGSINGRRFAYLTLVSDGASGYQLGKNFNNTGGIQVSDYGIDIRWAESRKQDLGLEIKTLNNNLSLIVDLFKEKRTGIFLQRQSIPGYVGLVSQPWGNLGVVDNRGIDATLDYNVKVGQVDLGFHGTFTYNRDKLINDDLPPQPYPWMSHLGNNILSRYGYQAVGLFTSQAEIDASAVPGAKSLVKVGDIKYKDLNGDGIINSLDQTRIGRGDVPNKVYGFGVSVGYKGFLLSTFFQGIAGADIELGGSAIQPFNGNGGLGNAYSNITDRWTPENPNQNAFYPRLAFGQDQNFNNTQNSSWWIKDVSFLRLKSAQLSYNLPQHFSEKLHVKNLAVYLIGANLLTFSKFKLWDPELNTNNGNGLADGSKYPINRTISLGLSVKF